MKKAKILGTGMYVPKKILTNEELSNMVDTSNEWIVSRTGIRERRISEGEDIVELAYRAGKNALENANLSPLDLDLILVSTSSCKSFFPSAACEVQNLLGAKNAAAFDILAACSGFVYALSSAKAYINSGMYKNILLIGSEVLSKVIDWEDRNTCVLFGDGAAAMVLSQGEEESILDVLLGADGSKSKVLTCGAMDFYTPFIKDELKISDTSDKEETEANSKLYKGNNKLHKDKAEINSKIMMNGKEVFKFAVTKVEECIRDLLSRNNETFDEIDYIVCHQANYRIIETVAKRLSVPMNKFYINLDRYGNTSSASIGIALHEMYEKNLIKHNNKIILVGFGAGLTWGAALLKI
ncbi:beta-ketoacyl-ACP synthase III [Hathewaya massiliensis]|uniref:beta-ketoacyl-ACP synthase III n=1 Tax=Hathewaya massiliensis TaxID=1964382 RepID=UPI00115B87A6|nr:beta-ketoacyl-ACP synthase III [Hathewaya massiliensis]